MAKDLPEEWTNGTLNTLYVVRDLGLKKSGVPADLRIKRKKGKTTSVLYAEYLPSEADDPRPHAGRTRNGEGRRITRESSQALRTPSRRVEGRLSGSWRINAMRERGRSERSKTSSTTSMRIGRVISPRNPGDEQAPGGLLAGNGMSP